MEKKFQHIADLSEICFQEGIKYIVISPGSRNAPLINAFYDKFRDSCFSIVDERSASYFGMGLARYSGQTVVLICTSGTAVLNYSPAIAEAYYSGVSMLVITADRPAEWIDQQDNQTIRQQNVYANFIKGSFHLPENINDLKAVHKTIREAIKLSRSGLAGPVHINVPVDEPLYFDIPPASNLGKPSAAARVKSLEMPADLISAWKKAKGILIVHGQDHPLSGVSYVLQMLSVRKNVVVVAENISNVRRGNVINSDDLLLRHSGHLLKTDPDLLIYSGGQVVSRWMKKYLRDLKNVETWRFGPEDYEMDTFRQNNRIISHHAKEVYEYLYSIPSPEITEETFRKSWLEALDFTNEKISQMLGSMPFSEVTSMKTILEMVPEGSVLELGNSTPVRIFQFFSYPRDVEVFSNRGVSGIDGCMSAAVGTATASKKLTILLIGDLSFVYDSNALWNRRLPSNLRIIIFNNSGGGIFNLLEGPSEKPAFQDFFIASHPVDIQKLAEAFNLHYFCCRSEDELIKTLPGFFEQSEKAGVLEIKTHQENNKIAYLKMMNK